jgi:hypothetical protein
MAETAIKITGVTIAGGNAHVHYQLQERATADGETRMRQTGGATLVVPEGTEAKDIIDSLIRDADAEVNLARQEATLLRAVSEELERRR